MSLKYNIKCCYGNDDGLSLYNFEAVHIASRGSLFLKDYQNRNVKMPFYDNPTNTICG